MSAPAVPDSSASPAATAEHLVKLYGSGNAQVRALDDVSVEVMPAQLTAIMGPSGSGKSTLMHCMAGLDRPTSGRALIGSTDVGSLKDAALTRLRRESVGFIFQQFNLVATLTARENILLPLAIAGRKPDPEWFETIIDTVGLADRLHHKPSELSGGQQQRVACARALVGRPAIIFADEPTGNLDSTSATDVLDFLQRCVEEMHQTIVMVTHDPVSASYADRALFLADGGIVEDLDDPTHDQVLATMARLDPRKIRQRARPGGTGAGITGLPAQDAPRHAADAVTKEA